MITIEVARSGDPILKKDGRALASTFDPKKEASDWVDKAVQSADPRDTLVILGLGSGYHVAELANRRSRQPLLVVECDSEITAKAREIHPDLHQITIVCEPEWRRLQEYGPIQDTLGNCFKLFEHGPSLHLHREYFQNVVRFFIGRDVESFLLQLKTRPDLYALFDSYRIGAIRDEVISVKTIQSLFKPEAGNSTERRLWRVLEELVQ